MFHRFFWFSEIATHDIYTLSLHDALPISERAEMMKEFYQHALKNEKTKFIYPTIIPDCMASINELLNTEYTTNDILFKLLGSLKTLGVTLNMDPVSTEEWALYDKYFERMIERNNKMIRNMKK